MMDTLDHLPPLPLIVHYWSNKRQDELAIYQVLRQYGRVRHIELSLSHSILHKALALMNEHFPILEHLRLLCFDREYWLPPTLPEAFLAPNLRHLTIVGVDLPKGLQVLTSTVSLVKLSLSNVQSSGYFYPRILLARLQSLPLLEELSVTFSIPIPHHGTERELLGEIGAPITLACLKYLDVGGIGAYLEPFVAQIRVPLLERLSIDFRENRNQIAFVPPDLSYLINITKVFKFSSAMVMFQENQVYVDMGHDHGMVQVWVSCPPSCPSMNQQIGVAARIYDALIPTLSDVEKLKLFFGYQPEDKPWISRVESAETWHNFLRRFVGVKIICTDNTLFAMLSYSLQVDEVRSDPGFLPNLQYVYGKGKGLTTRRVVGSPVQFLPA